MDIAQNGPMEPNRANTPSPSLWLPPGPPSGDSASRLGAIMMSITRQPPPFRAISAGLEAERRALQALERRQLQGRSGVEVRYRDMDLRNLPRWVPAPYRAAAAAMLNLLTTPQMVALCGERGTGKTALACGAVNAFCGAGKPAIYLMLLDFFSDLSKTAWDQKDAVWQKYLRPELVVLDEVQVRSADREWQEQELFRLIDKRYAAMKATVLISNLAPDALADSLGPSITRRLLEEGGAIACDWPRLLRDQQQPRMEIVA